MPPAIQIRVKGKTSAQIARRKKKDINQTSAVLGVFSFQDWNDLNPISTIWERDTLYKCDGFSAIQYVPLHFK
jgi:hypothetical protein